MKILLTQSHCSDSIRSKLDVGKASFSWARRSTQKELKRLSQRTSARSSKLKPHYSNEEPSRNAKE